MPDTQTLVFVKVVELSNDDILLLQTNPFDILDAPGLGKFNSFISASLINDFTEGNYSDVIGAYFELTYEGGDTISNSLAVEHFNGIRGVATLLHSVEDEVLDLSNVENKAIQLYINGSANLTDGNVLNTLKVSICYTIMDI